MSILALTTNIAFEKNKIEKIEKISNTGINENKFSETVFNKLN